MVLVNRSILQLLSGSKIYEAVCGIFDGFGKELSSDVKRVKIHHYIIACSIGVLMSLICVMAGVETLIIISGGVFAFVFLMKYLQLGVFLTVALSPMLPTMMLVGLSFICLAVFLIHAIIDDKFTFAKSPLNVSVVFFVIALIWGVINSFVPVSSLKQVMVHGSFIIFYFVIINVIRTKKQWMSLIKIFICSAFLVAVYGVIQNFFGTSSTESWLDEKMFTGIERRVYSFFNNPNVLGEFLVLTIPVVVALIWNKLKDSHKVLFSVILVFMVACMIFTWSRGAWLGMMIALALFLVISDKRWVPAGILVLFLVPVGLYLTGNAAILERFMSIGNTADTSTAYRVSIWQASIEMISDFLVGGIGIGSDAFTVIYPSYALSGANFALHSHNLYLQILVETGLIGIISLLAVLLGFLKTVFATNIVRKIKTSDMAKILVALGTGFLGFMFQGLTDYVWYNYKILMIFWIVIALGVSGAKIIKNDKGGDSL
jgi:putative inorganic carbon (HCO3(-)) transporter